MSDYSKILENMQKKYIEFKNITSTEMDMIALILLGENEYVSDSEWNDILYEAEKSKLIQEVLCFEDYYDSRNAHALAKHLSPEFYPEFMKKNQVRSATAEYICDRIEISTLKDIIENHPENISEPFRKVIRGYDFERANEIDFAHYKSFDKMDINAEYMVSKYKNNETIMTAISNNPNIRDDIRNEAFNSMYDPTSITNYTNYMKMSMYHNAAERIFDYPQETMEDAKQIAEAADTLLHMLENKMMPLSCEYDLLQRLQSMPSIGPNRKLTNALLQNTTDAIILKKAYEYNPTMTKNIIRKNKSCDIFTLEDFIKESIQKIKELTYKGENSMDILKEKKFVCDKLLNQPLSLESYRQLHLYAKHHDTLLDCMILASPFLRINAVKELFKSNKSDLVKLRELLESEFYKHGLTGNQHLKYLDFAIYIQMKDNAEYFKQSTSLSLKTFADRFDTPLQNVTEKEKEIIESICNQIDPEKEIKWIQ